MVKITIITDNCVKEKHLKAEWGFAALVEARGKTILFDTGADGAVLTGNMKEMGIKKRSIDSVFISHGHWDHIGGLRDFLKNRKVPVFSPAGLPALGGARNTIAVSEPAALYDGIYSTGTLKNIEQSMVIQDGKNTVVIAGCSHPGVKTILSAASRFGKPKALVGGLHGFKDFKALNGLKYVCATHCTVYKEEIKKCMKKGFIGGGSGAVIKIL